MRVATTLIILYLIANDLYAQQQHRLGFHPTINLSYKVSNLWKVNTKIESRNVFLEGISDEGTEWQFEYLRTDIEMVAAYKTGLHSSLGGGYMLRITSEGTFAHRAKQQYSLVRQFNTLRLGHRFATDQTFREEVPVEYRLRYRLSLEVPLNGHDIDPREFYLKANSELLLSSFDELDVEVRGVGVLGYEINARNKLETGIDYRILCTSKCA